MNVNQIAAVEALLFTAPEPLSLNELADTIDVTVSEIRDILTVIKTEYNEKKSHGIQLKEYNQCYLFVTKEHLAPYIKKLHDLSRTTNLSQAALETLAIVAYRQPVTRPEIEDVRGVSCEGTIRTLLKYNLIKKAGQQDTTGNPIVYRTTKEFLRQFALESLEDLPRLDKRYKKT